MTGCWKRQNDNHNSYHRTEFVIGSSRGELLLLLLLQQRSWTLSRRGTGEVVVSMETSRGGGDGGGLARGAPGRSTCMEAAEASWCE